MLQLYSFFFLIGNFFRERRIGAICGVMAKHKVTGSLCNKYVFRCSVNSPQNSTAGAIVAAEEGYQKWTTIGPDYAFGRQSWELFQKALQERKEGVEFLKTTAFPKLGVQDYNSFITKLQNSGTDAIWCSLWGNDLVNFIRQANNFGLFERFPVYMELGAAMEVFDRTRRTNAPRTVGGNSLLVANSRYSDQS